MVIFPTPMGSTSAADLEIVAHQAASLILFLTAARMSRIASLAWKRGDDYIPAV